MDIQGLSLYLKKFQILLGDKTEEKRAIQEGIHSLCRVSVDLNQITIKNFCVYVEATPIEKTEIIRKKKELIALFSEKQIVITDLR